MKQLLKNFARFFYDQKYQATISWVKYTTKLASSIHHHIWTSVRFPAGFITILIYHYIDPWIALAFFFFSALTDWFDGKVARNRQDPEHPMTNSIDNYVQKLKHKEKNNLLERIVSSENFGDVLDGTADKFFICPLVWYFGYNARAEYDYWPLILLMIVIDAAGNPIIKVLEKKGQIKSNGKMYKHSIAGKIKYTLQVVLVLLLWSEEVFPYKYQEVTIYFVLSIATTLALLSVFCKAKPSTCEKLWQSNNN